MTQGSSPRTPSERPMTPLRKSWALLKAPRNTTYCCEKNCFAHASKFAPEDGKAYCDIHVSDHMKEPKPKKEEPSKTVGVSDGKKSSVSSESKQAGY